ncbi:MAG TPA: T9SS type A sorting domain-containing protein [Edaphocola sp.]|nr:T9SS type A sorting domain-containing protein [Edaphocola sp.]
MKIKITYLILPLFLFIFHPNISKAQYKGGIDDGAAIKTSSNQNQTPNIYKGSNNDGHASKLVINQNPIPNIYTGGGNDGVASKFISSQNTLPNIYAGGGNDGTAIFSVLSLNQSPSIYFGGANDGASLSFVSDQNPGVKIYFGGANDGASSSIIAFQNKLPEIYFGGGNDGVSSLIILKQNSSDPMPILLFSFDGNWKDNGALLNWETNVTLEINNFELERSINRGLSFESIAQIPPNPNFGEPVYKYLDSAAWNLPSNLLLYRLKLISITDEVTYSTIVKLEKSRTAPILNAYPNPSNGKLTLHIQNETDLSEYKYQLYNVTGQSLKSGSITSAKSSFDFSSYTSGIYQLVIFKNGIVIQNFKIVLNQ